MTMVAGKMDAVSVNRVWEEHVKKENQSLRLNDTFCIADPRKMPILPEKPNRTVPTQNPDAATIQMANATINSLAAFKSADQLPTQRFALPVTGNMEYGFYNSLRKDKPNPMFHHPLSTCDVTGYAVEYSLSNGGVGPYTNKLSH